MSVTVSCPGCQAACTAPPEALGRTGRCTKCGIRIRLATPVAERIDAPAEPLELPPEPVAVAPVSRAEPLFEDESLLQDDPVSPPRSVQPLPRPGSQPVLRPIAEEDWPDSPVLLDAPAEEPVELPVAPPAERHAPARERDEVGSDRRGRSKLLLAALAVLALIVGGVGGALLIPLK